MLLPNVPQHCSQLRLALSALQQQLDKLVGSGSGGDRVEGGLAAAALCIVVHRTWQNEASAAAAAAAAAVSPQDQVSQSAASLCKCYLLLVALTLLLFALHVATPTSTNVYVICMEE
jgi:hypothetical protein